MDNRKNSRRDFIVKTGLAGSAITLGMNGVNALNGKSVGANDKVRMGFIGIGNRGSQLLTLFMTQPDCEVVALCDVYEPYLMRDPSKVDKRYSEGFLGKGGQVPKMEEGLSKEVKRYSDYCKLLEDKNIDAVCIATPDHWHALITIQAMQAGKDVYVEKPLTQTIFEGRKMVEAQTKTKRVCAVGLNRRGSAVFQKLAKEIQAGKIGKVTVGKASHVNDMFPDGIGNLKPENPPKDFNWDFWLGPRAFIPYQYNIAPYTFRWWKDYSSQMGNWGVHYMDAIRWMMGETAPVAITAHGGKFVLHDDSTIPDTLEVVFEFASGAIITFTDSEVSSAKTVPFGELELRGTKGTLYADEYSYQYVPARKGQFQSWTKQMEAEEYTSPAKMLADGSSSTSTTALIRNFLDCIKSRNAPLCPLEEGHRSTSFAHLANIALATRDRLQWDAVNERFTNSEAANKMLHYEYRKPWKL